MKKIRCIISVIVLTVVAVIVKILLIVITGLIYSNDIVTYTSLVSRTHAITGPFLFYILTIDIITLVIFTHISTSFFKVANTIGEFIIFSLTALFIFLGSDVIFMIEIKSGKTIHHFFTFLLLLEKHTVYMLLSSAYILQVYKINQQQRIELFLDYNNFKFRNVVSEKYFLFSKFLYTKGIGIILYACLVFYIDFLSLYLYQNSALFFINILVCCIILAYLLIMVIHQMNIVLDIYKTYTVPF